MWEEWGEKEIDGQGGKWEGDGRVGVEMSARGVGKAFVGELRGKGVKEWG